MIIFTCREFVELVTEAQEDALRGTSAWSYRVHRLWCRHCRAYEAQMLRTTELVRQLGRERGDR